MIDQNINQRWSQKLIIILKCNFLKSSIKVSSWSWIFEALVGLESKVFVVSLLPPGALTLPPPAQPSLRHILLYSTLSDARWCLRPVTQVSRGQVGLPMLPLAKTGDCPAHAMCQGGCMQPYGSGGDSCNVAWHRRPFNRQLISLPHHIL